MKIITNRKISPAQLLANALLALFALTCVQCANDDDANASDDDDKAIIDVRSPGCGTAVTRPEADMQQIINVNGTDRYYLLNVPSNVDNTTPRPLIFALHGYDMNNVAVTGLYNFNLVSKGEAITVYPQGEGPAPGDSSHWGDGVLKSTWEPNDANFNFIGQLMTDLKNKYCIDTNRVFITGFSMGGMFTNALACERNNWFRAYAPVSGGGPDSCTNANAKSAVMIHHGTKDPVVPESSGEASRDFWVQQNGCDPETTATYIGCVSNSNCPADAPVTYCLGDWDHTITVDATSNIWSFFDSLK